MASFVPGGAHFPHSLHLCVCAFLCDPQISKESAFSHVHERSVLAGLGLIDYCKPRSSVQPASLCWKRPLHRRPSTPVVSSDSKSASPPTRITSPEPSGMKSLDMVAFHRAQTRDRNKRRVPSSPRTSEWVQTVQVTPDAVGPIVGEASKVVDTKGAPGHYVGVETCSTPRPSAAVVAESSERVHTKSPLVLPQTYARWVASR